MSVVSAVLTAKSRDGYHDFASYTATGLNTYDIRYYCGYGPVSMGHITS